MDQEADQEEDVGDDDERGHQGWTVEVLLDQVVTLEPPEDVRVLLDS